MPNSEHVTLIFDVYLRKCCHTANTYLNVVYILHLINTNCWLLNTLPISTRYLMIRDLLDTLQWLLGYFPLQADYNVAICTSILSQHGNRINATNLMAHDKLIIIVVFFFHCIQVYMHQIFKTWITNWKAML